MAATAAIAAMLMALVLCAAQGADAVDMRALRKTVDSHMKKAHSLFDDAFDVRAAFNMHDYNGDGYLDRGEAWALYEDDPLTDKQIEQQLDMTFGVMDKDKDGRMSFKEFAHFFERATKNKPLLPELT